MSDAVWRCNDPGFQEQAVGNYPAKSDCADKDNIYLSDEGWVYRHYKSLDKSKYWDEVIWAGAVTDPPAENEPINAFPHTSVVYPSRGGGSYLPGQLGTADPDFLVGDGVQFVSGPYPTASTTIKEISINAAENGDTATAIPFKAVLEDATGAIAVGNTWAWSVSGPGTATFSAGTATGTFSGTAVTESNVSITFPDAGSYTVSLVLGSGADGDSTATHHFQAAANVADDLIGAYTISGTQTPQVGIGITYTANPGADTTAPEADCTYTWSASPSAGVTITQPGDDPLEAKVVFSTQGSVVETTITCVINDASAADDGKTITYVVTPHFVIGTPVVGGPATASDGVQTAVYSVTYTGQSNPVPNDLTYKWDVTPNSAGVFDSDTSATPKFTPAETGTCQINVVVSSAKSEPTTETSADYEVVVS